MKRKIGIIAMSSLIGASLIGTVFSTLSWFDNYLAVPDNKIDGQVEGAYFAYGDGTENDPYGISRPRHLYNLAWLQYSGRFNRDADDDGQLDTFYFEIAKDVPNGTLDMDGYTLPPIGTKENPFIGQFNGNKKIIKNLAVSNIYSDYGVYRPSNLAEDTFNQKQPQIVGVFGVVGELDTDLSYDTSANKIENTGMLNVTVKSGTSQTLAGIAAGYVNGTISNVAINSSSLYTSVNATSLQNFDNVSDYSLVGFATDDALSSMKLRSDDADIPLVENPNTVQGGDNWGGSINMQEMYTYLAGVRRNSTRYAFSTNETVTTDIDGNTDTVVNATTQNGRYDSDFGYTSYTGAKAVVNEKEYASFSIATSYSNNSFNTLAREQYVCLYGNVQDKRGTTAGNRSTNNATKTVVSNTEYHVITDGGTNYLRATSNTPSNSTSQQNGCHFLLDASGYLYTVTGTKYYLYNNNGNLRAATTSQNNNDYKWVYDATNHRLSVSNGAYYLRLSGTTWGLLSASSTINYYSFSNNGKYLNANGTTLEYSTGNNTKWYQDGSNYYTYINQQKYYICYSGSNVVLSTNGNKLIYDSNKFYYTTTSGFIFTTTYYHAVLVNGSSLTINPTGNSATSPSNIGTAFTRNSGSEYEYLSSIAYYTVVTYQTTATNQATYYDTYPTYFPLTRDKDEAGNYTSAGNAGKPDEKNTGYLVSGANMTTPTNQVPFGDIRVSYFAMNYLNNALNANTYNNSSFEVVTRTCIRGDDGHYTDSEWTRIEDDYNSQNSSVSTDLSNEFSNKKNYKTVLRLNKYKASRTQLGASLSTGGGNIYGLHFMDASISTQRLITAPNVIVLDGKSFDDEGKAIGSVYTDYQLPQDAIDFNLKDMGFINFFAGSYFTSNNAFFSLHQIVRNNDEKHTISAINEIQKIYAPKSGDVSAENPYVYQFGNSKPSNAGDLVFDTAWIKSPDIVMNAAYYFEIPVNAGEYALGSVAGGIGAYLMYLDIGAGIANYQDISTTEKVITTMKLAKYPKGIDFKPLTQGADWAAVVGGESATVAVASSSSEQTWEYSYSSGENNSTLTVTTSGNDPPLSVTSQARNVSVYKSNGTTTSLVNFSPTNYTMTMDRVTEESFNIFTSVVSRSVTETYTIVGCSNGDKIQLPKPVTTTGYTVVDAIAYSVKEGDPASVDNNGLVTISGSGSVEVTMVFTESRSNVETWDSATYLITDDTVGKIFEFHFYDYDDPNIGVRYVYDGVNKTYTIYISASAATILDIDLKPPVGYTVIINDGTNTVTIVSTTEANSVPISAKSS